MPTKARDQGQKELLTDVIKDHITAKGMNSMAHHSLVLKFIPTLQALKIPDAKAAVEKEWEKLKKNPAWQLSKVRNKKEVFAEAKNKGRKVHFASLMDLCHLKNSELELQKYKGVVVFRGDIGKDDSGSYAVLTEQGSSTSHMTATHVMDVIARLPGCAGQAADAVSDYIQVRREDAPRLLVHYGRPSRLSRKESVRSPSCRTIMGKAIWESSIGTRLAKTIFNWECLFVNRARGLFLSVYVDEHHFLTMYIWVAFKESVKSARILWETTKKCSNPGFLLEPRENYRPKF